MCVRGQARGQGSGQHVELDQSPSKHRDRPNDADGHEDTEQDVIQDHGHKLPLLCCVVGLLVGLHGLGDVLDSLDGAADIWVFGDGGLVGDAGGGGVT